MTRPTPALPAVLGFHPTAKGFGFIVFTSPFAPVTWGTSKFSGDRNGEALRKIERIINRQMPETLVLEVFDGPQSNRSDRVKRLCQAVVALAKARGIEVERYTQGEVAETFTPIGAKTRDEIAAAVALHVDALRYKLPPARRDWQPEDPRRGMFTAAALVLTHYRVEAGRVLRLLQ